jgi:hypothetical protein
LAHVKANLVDEAIQITYDLRMITPIDTGSAAGRTVNQVGSRKRKRYPSHPAHGMPWNTLGWKYTAEQASTNRYAISITNKMWKPYLEMVNAFHPTMPGFVQLAWDWHKDRMRTMIPMFNVKVTKSGETISK